jgi:hypothetical protein
MEFLRMKAAMCQRAVLTGRGAGKKVTRNDLPDGSGPGQDADNLRMDRRMIFLASGDEILRFRLLRKTWVARTYSIEANIQHRS